MATTRRAKSLRNVKNRVTPVTERRGAAEVREDTASYQRTHNALAMLKLVAIAKHSLVNGTSHSHQHVFTAAQARLAEHLHDQ